MSIAKRKPTAEVPVNTSALPQVQPAPYKGVVYDDKNTPLVSLIAYISGAPWSVNYYSQVVGEHNDLREIDPGQSGVYQQYKKTIGLELRVENALNSSYDNERGITTVTGSANVYPFMVPNVADYICADAGSNRYALFRVTQVDRKSFNRDSVYTIEYELIGYVEQNRELYDNIESKVVKSFHFSKDRLIEGLSPTLRTEDYHKVINLKSLYSDLVRYYYKSFFDIRFGTLVIPGQERPCYDSFLANYISTLVETTDAPEIMSVRNIPTDRETYLSQPQFWDLLRNKDYNGKAYTNNKMGLVSKTLFNRNSFVQGLAFSNINYVVYPDNPDTSAYIGTMQCIKPILSTTLVETIGQNNVVFTLAENQLEAEARTYKLIHDVLVDDFYVLSAEFYNETQEQSVLEILVKDYLKGNTIDLSKLYAVTDTFRKWKRLEQYYYGPILMTLIKEADRAQYS